ncbi:MAG: hypothetical protein U1E70_24220 [Acetobacteraceae bacterium]
MRRALGLLGDVPRQRPEVERADPPPRPMDRFGGGGGLHRRRFVQDGDVPVTVLRREPGHDAPAHRVAPTGSAAPTSSRLQRVEALYAAEQAARSQADRALQEAQVAVRDLQTKIGHAELAKTEAVEALRRERDGIGALRQALEAARAEVVEANTRVAELEHALTAAEDALAEERQTRRALEKSLRAAESARDAAEQLVRTLSEEADEPAPVRVPVRFPVADDEPVVEAPRRRGRPPRVLQPVVPETEPEPVKWWLTPAKAAPRRR